MAMCIFEAPTNKAYHQHAQMGYEGIPGSTLMVRSVLTVGNYDYTQTFEVELDGKFHWHKELSGYAVGHYVVPGLPSSTKQDIFGSFLSTSSVGTLHTHSAAYKFDLDIAGTANNFGVKTLKYGPMEDAFAASSGDSPMDLTGVAYSNPSTYYFETSALETEGTWDMDGDDVWTPPESCYTSTPGNKYLIKSTQTDMYGQYRGYALTVPIGQFQIIPEGDPYLHLQNVTKCSLLVTKRNEADVAAMSGSGGWSNLYPSPAPDGDDISTFVDGESLVDEDLVIYASSTTPHYVITEDVPVPVTMGKPISFSPVNYAPDAVNNFKHLPFEIKAAEPCVATGARR